MCVPQWKELNSICSSCQRFNALALAAMHWNVTQPPTVWRVTLQQQAASKSDAYHINVLFSAVSISSGRHHTPNFFFRLFERRPLYGCMTALLPGPEFASTNSVSEKKCRHTMVVPRLYDSTHTNTHHNTTMPHHSHTAAAAIHIHVTAGVIRCLKVGPLNPLFSQLKIKLLFSWTGASVCSRPTE